MLCTTMLLFARSLSPLAPFLSLPLAEPVCGACGACIPRPRVSDLAVYLQSVFRGPWQSRSCKTVCPKGKSGSEVRTGACRGWRMHSSPRPHPAMSHFLLPVFPLGLQRARRVHTGERYYALIIRQRLTSCVLVISAAENIPLSLAVSGKPFGCPVIDLEKAAAPLPVLSFSRENMSCQQGKEGNFQHHQSVRGYFLHFKSHCTI